jgi:hypothetical protein
VVALRIAEIAFGFPAGKPDGNMSPFGSDKINGFLILRVDKGIFATVWCGRSV